MRESCHWFLCNVQSLDDVYSERHGPQSDRWANNSLTTKQFCFNHVNLASCYSAHCAEGRWWCHSGSRWALSRWCVLTCQVMRNQATVSGGSGGYVILGWIVRRMPVRSTVRETCRAHIQNQRNVLSKEGWWGSDAVRSPGPVSSV